MTDVAYLIFIKKLVESACDIFNFH